MLGWKSKRGRLRMQGRRRGRRSRRLGIGRKQRWLLREEPGVVLRAELRAELREELRAELRGPGGWEELLREELRAELREELLLEGVSAAARKTPRKTRRKLLEEPEDPGELPAGPGARCLAGGALPAWRRTTPVRTSSHIIAP
jgi:hypothetical protein